MYPINFWTTQHVFNADIGRDGHGEKEAVGVMCKAYTSFFKHLRQPSTQQGFFPPLAATFSGLEHDTTMTLEDQGALLVPL